MTVDLKVYYDKAQQARSEQTLIVNSLNALIADGTKESEEKALAMRPELEKANQMVDEADALYNAMCASMKDAGKAPALFVPVPTEAVDGETKAKNEMKREDFFALDSAEQMKHIKNGGKVTD